MPVFKTFSRLRTWTYFLVLALVLSACGKETFDDFTAAEAIDNNSLTTREQLTNPDLNHTVIQLDNWKNYVHAPQALIDAQNEATSIAPIAVEVPTELRRDPLPEDLLFGYVQAFNNGWQPIPQVAVTTETCSTSTVVARPFNYFLDQECTSPLCMAYPTRNDNGVDVTDILRIYRHIIGIAPFREAREYLAADVDRDGIISENDIMQIRDVILDPTVGFRNSDNVIFLDEADYVGLQAIIAAGQEVEPLALKLLGEIDPCLSISFLNRRAIKTGDVSGNFVF